MIYKIGMPIVHKSDYKYSTMSLYSLLGVFVWFCKYTYDDVGNLKMIYSD